MKEHKGILGGLHTAADLLEKFINFCCCVFISGIALSVVTQVIFREINIPIVWLGELGVYCLIWAVFFGLAIGYRNGLFAQVDIICHLVPKSWIKYLELLWDVIGLVIMGIILWSSREYIAHVARSGTLSPELSLPLWAVYLGPVFGYIFTSFFTFVNICERVARLKAGGAPQEGEVA